MKILDYYIFEKLQAMINESPRFDLPSKLVIFSDLHMGDGGKNDDFLPNADLFYQALTHYRNEGHALVLNGDIEELQRSSLDRIMKRHQDIYSLIDSFFAQDKLFKTVGNHDSELAFMKNPPYAKALYGSFAMRFGGSELNFFHGHQASYFFEKFNTAAGKILKYVANPLGIRNMASDYRDTSRFQTERRVYLFGKAYGAVSVIGHTHRPLFDSVDKADHLRAIIDDQLRVYIAANDSQKVQIRKRILGLKAELEKTDEKKRRKKFGLYNTDRLVLPCVFNSGTVIGKSGITCLEINGADISLMHWYDSSTRKKNPVSYDYAVEPMNDKGLYRVCLDSENLNYVMARMSLLTGSGGGFPAESVHG